MNNFQNNFSFADYVTRTRDTIARQRHNGQRDQDHSFAIDANSPFEVLPADHQQHSIGLLMVHGLFDSPYTFREVAPILAKQGVHCRAILLPGHGTQPEDLFTVHHQQWQDTVEFGIRSFGPQVKKIFLMGFSLGALLSLKAFTQHPEIAGFILLVPPFRLHPRAEWLLAHFKPFFRWKKWVSETEEMNQVRYLSISVNAVLQLDALRQSLFSELNTDHLPPVLMFLSEEDETVDSRSALQWFQQLKDDHHRLVLYSHAPYLYEDVRIHSKTAYFPHLRIEHFSHCSLCFSSRNSYYGVEGTYPFASGVQQPDVRYGAYNRMAARMSKLAWRLHLRKQYCQELTYNPDFDFLMQQISLFLQS